MNGVKLCNIKHSPSLKDYISPWEFYKPVDYYGRGSQIAKKYCKDHPEANKDVVYMAASEAAALYNLGGLKTRAKFSTVVHVKIRAALLQHKRKIAALEPLKDERTEKMITPEERKSMIADRLDGMSYTEIAKKYRRNKSTITNNLLNWEEAGLFTRENAEKPTKQKPEKKKAPEAAPEPVEELPGQIKLEPEPEAAPSPVYGLSSNAISVSDFKPNVWDALSAEMSCALCNALGAGTTVIGRSYIEGKAKVKVRTADGKTYEMRVKEVHVHEWED